MKSKSLKNVLFWQVENYMDVIAPIHVVAAFCGSCSAYKFDKRISFAYGRLLARYLILITWYSTFFYFGRANYKENYYETLSNNTVANTGRRIQLFLGMIMCSVGIFSTYRVARFCRHFIEGMTRFDRGLEQIGHTINFKTEAIVILFLILYDVGITTLTIWISTTFFDICETFNLFFHIYVPGYITGTMYLTFIVRFICYAFSATYRFKTVNRCLVEFLEIKQSHEFDFKKIPSQAVKNLRKNTVFDYAKLHGILTESISQLNQCYGFQLMMVLGLTFCYAITTIFTVFRTLVYGDNSLNSLSGSFSLWSAYYILPMIAVIGICDNLKSTVSNW